MRVLILGLNFAPELTGIGKYTGEMAHWLAARGHEVRVVCAPPYYPAWRVADGYRAWAYRTEEADGLKVWRCPLWVPAKPGGAKRLLHLASFALVALPAMLRHVFWRPDVVWTVAPALASAPVAWLTARLSGAPVWLHIQDFEVDAAFELGLLKGDTSRKIAVAIESGLLNRFDCVSSISRSMVNMLDAKAVADSKRCLFPNWVDLDAVTAAPRLADDDASGFRHDLGIPDDGVVALYSGNMGAKQGLEILPELARRLSDQGKLWFVFCGDGSGKTALALDCEGLPRVRLLPLQPLSRLGSMLRAADIHLMPQRRGAANAVLPSKLTGMLASGRPVIAGAEAGTELATTVEGCGLVVEPECAESFESALRLLAGDPTLRTELGRNARTRAESAFSRDAILGEFEARLKALVQGRR